jgi:hypothetical protein
MHIPPNVPWLYIASISELAYEREVLIPGNLVFNVVDTVPDPIDGITRYVCEYSHTEPLIKVDLETTKHNIKLTAIEEEQIRNVLNGCVRVSIMFRETTDTAAKEIIKKISENAKRLDVPEEMVRGEALKYAVTTFTTNPHSQKLLEYLMVAFNIHLEKIQALARGYLTRKNLNTRRNEPAIETQHLIPPPSAAISGGRRRKRTRRNVQKRLSKVSDYF